MTVLTIRADDQDIPAVLANLAETYTYRMAADETSGKVQEPNPPLRRMSTGEYTVTELDGDMAISTPEQIAERVLRESFPTDQDFRDYARSSGISLGVVLSMMIEAVKEARQ